MLKNLFSGSLKELKRPPRGQISFLDGLRSIAILLVVSGHLSASFSKTYGPTAYSRLPFVQNGWVGVDLFFVLSGFFIGGQLWKELRRRHTIDVRRFVIRRGLRIWPLYFFIYLCVLTVAVTLGGGAAAHEYGWSDLLFVTNYHNRGIVEGSWSLCTEEQFYIIAPIVLYLMARKPGGLQRCRPWLWLAFCSLPLLRAALWVHGTGHFFTHDPALFQPIYYMSITHCDGLILGLIIANHWETQTKATAKIANPWSIVVVAGLVAGILHGFQKEIFDFTALALLFGALVWLGLQHQFRIFNSRAFYWISRLSFGMYLNHEYLAPWVVGAVLPHLSHIRLVSNLLGVVILVALSSSVALVTYCLVEHPFLQLRKLILGTAETPASAAPDLQPVTQ